jgi:hypothetical protein
MDAWNTLYLSKDNINSSERRLRFRSNGVSSTPVPHDNNTSSVPIVLGAIASGNGHFQGEISDYFTTNGDFDSTGLKAINDFTASAYGGLSF